MRLTAIDTLGRAVAIACCLAVAACSGGPGAIQPTLTPGPSAVPSSATPGSSSSPAAPLDTATPPLPPGSPAASAPAVTSPPQTPLPSRAPTSIKAGDVVATLVDDLRVRSKPRVTDSVKYEPLLPAGTKLYVLDGPVEGSGYEWFWVAQLSAPELPSGWVARAGRDGEAWLGTSTFDCPVAPDDFLALLGLPRGVGLACFSRTPITFKARLFELNGDPTPGSDWITPTWLFSVGGGPAITDPSASGPYWMDPCCGLEHPYLELLVDPDGTYPARLPIGRYVEGITWTLPDVVRLTGMFDHPAAQACRWDSHDENPDVALPLDPAVGTCRLEFAVTRIVVP